MIGEFLFQKKVQFVLYTGSMSDFKNKPFEEILIELEKVVRDLEANELPLDEALARFEAGVALSKEGAARLSHAERRIEEILADGSTQSFDEDSTEKAK